MGETRSYIRSRLFDCWIVVLLHAALLAFVVRDGGLTAIACIASVVFLCIAVIGTVLKWGPVVLCTLGGYYFGFFWFPSPYLYTHNAMERAIEEIGLPWMWSILGLLIGFVADYAQSDKNECAEEDQTDRNAEKNDTP